MVQHPIKRNRYFELPNGPECDVLGRHAQEDFQNFHLRSADIERANLHDWGIAQGLDVSGPLGSDSITIHAGVAIDRQGRLIVLADQGQGDIGSNPPNGQHDERSVPVQLNLNSAGLVNPDPTHSAYYVTIQFSEIIRNEGPALCGRFEQVPWIRLQPVTGGNPAIDDGSAIVLAIVVLDAAGKLAALKTQDHELPYRRRLVGKTVEQLQIQKAQLTIDVDNTNTTEDITAGKLKPAEEGGLQLTVPHVTDRIVLTQDDGNSFAELDIRANIAAITGYLELQEGVAINEFSSDATLSGESDLAVPTEKAVKAYITNQLDPIQADLAQKASQQDLSGSLSRDFAANNLELAGDLKLRGRDIRDAGGTPRISIFDNGRLDFKEDQGATAFSIDTSGNIGIGTTNPKQKLHIYDPNNRSVFAKLEARDSNAYWIADVGGDNGGGLIIQNQGIDKAFVYWTNNNPSRFAIDVNGGDRFTILNNGNVGIGTTTPEARLHVRNTISESSGIFAHHVMAIENTGSGDAGPDVLAIKTNLSSPIGNTNFITFMDREHSIGAIEGGGNKTIHFKSRGGDYAEYLPRLDEHESLKPGDIVGVFGGKITKRTAAAHHLMVISDRPVVLGNAPDQSEAHLYEPVAFLGQVAVAVRGKVQEGDYILASGLHDGVGIAVPPYAMQPQDYSRLVGRAWEASDQEPVKRINVAIGLETSAPWLHSLSNLSNQIQTQSQVIERLKSELETLRQATVRA